MDLIDLLLSILRFNRSSIYRELVVLASISQNIRRPNKKNSFKRNFRKIYLYASLFKRILSIYSLKNLLIKLFYKENKKINNDLLIIYPNGDEWILRGLSKDLSKELSNQNLNMRESGCISLDLAYVGAGRLDGVWGYDINILDIAAGALIAQEGGALTSNFLGDPKYINGNNIVVSTAKIYKSLLKSIKPYFKG